MAFAGDRTPSRNDTGLRALLQTRTLAFNFDEALGLEFNQAWNRRDVMEYEGQKFFVACKTDLIASKKAAGRAVDREDVRLLELPDTPAD